MFFIKSQSAFRKKDIVLLHVVPTAFVITALLVVSFAGWLYAERSYARERVRVVKQINQTAAAHIQQRISTYKDMLRTSASLFTVLNKPTRQDWRSFTNTLDIMERYPGAQGIGYAPYIRSGNLSNFLTDNRQTLAETFDIFPDGSREVYTPITFLEPGSPANESVIGYDMFSENSRRKAMESARDSGLASLTSKITLLQEQTLHDTQPGFLMYYAVYKGGITPESPQKKSADILGFVYMPFRAHDFMANTVSIQDELYEFTVTDGQTNETLYSNKTNSTQTNTQGRITAKDTIQVAGADWLLTSSAPNTIAVTAIPLQPGFILLIGVASSILIGSLMYLLILNRARLLAQTEEHRIREAKDELLALASHQLRTPATGVKQYVGMLKEGLAGKLTETQHNIIEKAYQSNERQLNTINEMLFVARADAGHLKMDMRVCDFRLLVCTVVEEHRLIIEKKQQKLRTQLKGKPTLINCDEFYLRMAVENILSNATKYTPNKGQICIKIQEGYSGVFLSIEDNGVGVDKKDHGLLFQKFSRIPNAMSRFTSGSGIGLYLAKTVIKNHGGSITFSSDTGKGSTVVIFLPMYQSLDTQNKA